MFKICMLCIDMRYINFNIPQLTFSMERGVQFTGGIKPAFGVSEDPTRFVDYINNCYNCNNV